MEVVLKALDILDAFQSRPILTLKEIAGITQMTRSRAMRLTGTLESRGYLLYEGEERQFRVGPKLLTLGKVFEEHNTIGSISRPILRDLVKMTGELASLYIMDGLERVALVREKASHDISYTVVEGQRMELYAGAAGKVLLAFAPADIQKKVLSRNFLKKITPNTLSDPKQLARELEAISRNGYAVSEGERAPDVWSVAAPVFDDRGAVCCAIGITGPAYRIGKQRQLIYKDMVISKAGELSRCLGGHSSLYSKEDQS